MDIGRPATSAYNTCNCISMPSSSITSVKALKPRQLRLEIPPGPVTWSLLVNWVPKSGSGVATFWSIKAALPAPQVGAPVVSDSSSVCGESDTYRGNCRVGGAERSAMRRVRTTRDSEVRARCSYFGVRLNAEQSHEVIGVVAASWRRTRICNCPRPIPEVSRSIQQSQHKLTLPF
jgi:hypothetical protein